MAVSNLATFQTTFAALPRVADTSFANNIAAWYAARINGLEPNSAQFVPTGFSFTFAESVFATQLLNLSPTMSAVEGVTKLADAWAAAILASSIAVGPGSFIPPSTPATLFSVVASSTFDAASVTLGRSKILELIHATPVTNALDSEFPIKLRDAILILTFTVVGTDSITPVPGPLTAASVGVI
jgi:hypothetical protein